MREIKVELGFDIDTDNALDDLSSLIHFLENDLNMYGIRDVVVKQLHSIVDQNEVNKFLESL